MADEKEKRKKASDEESDTVSLHINITLPKRYTGMLNVLTEGHSNILFTPSESMCLDDSGLVHSSFLMSVAEYSVYCAVNSKNTYIQTVKAEYLAPLEVNFEYVIDAEVLYVDKKKQTVFVQATHNNIAVFDAEFHILVLDDHILDVKLNEK